MDNLQLLNEALALHNGIMQFADAFVINRNNGGINVRFFSSKAKFSVATVYENDFWKFPPELKWVGEKALQIGATMEAERQAITEYEPAKKKGLLNQMPLVWLLRYQLGSGDDQEKWRFHGIYKVFATKRENAQETPKPQENADFVSFKDADEACDWAVKKGAFQTKEQALVALRGLATTTRAEKEQLALAWQNRVEQVLKSKKRHRNGNPV